MSVFTEGAAVNEVARRGRTIYDERLKALLEPLHNGESVAVHIDSGDYDVADQWFVARRRLRMRQPSGMIASFTIGPATDNDFALANRIDAGQKP